MNGYNYTDRSKMLHALNPSYIVKGDDREGFNKVIKTALSGLNDPEDYTMNLLATNYDELFGYIDGAIIIIYSENSPMNGDATIGIKDCGVVLSNALQLYYMDHTKLSSNYIN